MKKTLVLLFSFWITLVGFSQTTFTDSDSHYVSEGDWQCFPIMVSEVGLIDDNYGLTQVCVKLKAETDSDISMVLVAPDGTQVLLTSNNGGSGDNYYTTCFTMTATSNITTGTAPFDGDFLPEGDLGLFNNFQDANGKWQLCILDENSNGDDVTLVEWALTFDENPSNHITRIMYSCEDDNAYFYDLAGDNADYNPNETHYWVICSENSMNIELNFEVWAVEDSTNDDRLTIWNSNVLEDNFYYAIGDGLNSLLHATVRADNPTGCLTLRWFSDRDDEVGEGWKAKIACYIPCQKVEYVWDESIPSSDTNYIAACQGQEITFNAHGVYPENDDAYHQKDETSIFVWSFGDGQQDTGTTVHHAYIDQQGYNVDLEVIDTIGCRSHIYLEKRVMISKTPTFKGTYPGEYPIEGAVCIDSCLRLMSETQTFGWMNTSTTDDHEKIIIDTVLLADATGGYYYSYLDVKGFKPGDTVANGLQIDSILINMEHSWVGDLSVWIICPNDSAALLFDGNAYDGGSNTYLGIPGDDDGNADLAGEGWDYVFSMSANVNFEEAPETDDKVTTIDGEQENYSIQAGIYHPDYNLDNLIGCPFNGTWTIKIQDDQTGDDGYLFKWGLWFNDTLYDNNWGYRMSVVDSLWSGSDDLYYPEDASRTVACPQAEGENIYTYTITDQFGCSYDTTLQVVRTDLKLVIDTIILASCGEEDGKIEISVSGGSGNYTIEWSNGDTGPVAESLSAGEYFVQVKDADIACEVIQFFYVNNIDAPTVSLEKIDLVCYNQPTGSAIAHISEGTPSYTVEWSTESNDTIISNLSAGIYSITVTDASNCIMMQSVEITQPMAMRMTFDITNAFCNKDNGKAEISISGGSGDYLIEWFNGDIGSLADSLSAGIHAVYVKDNSSGCIDSSLFNVSKTDMLTVSIEKNDLLCYEDETGSAIAHILGGYPPYFIEWSTESNNTIISNLSVGIYSLTVSDTADCTISQSVEITQPESIEANFNIINSICSHENGAVFGDVSGGTLPYTYHWNIDSITANITNLLAGSYTLSVEDKNHCKQSFVVDVSNEGSIEVIVDSIHSAGCGEEGGVFVSVSGGTEDYSYVWSNGEEIQDLDGFASGDYQLKVTDGSCIYILNTNIPYIYPPEQSICIVTVDTATVTNSIIWERGDDHLVGYYNIYREDDASEFILIASVDADELTEYKDTTADPSKDSWRYKIATADTCGNESALSSSHKTIYLEMVEEADGSFKLNWDNYEGIDYTMVSIYRKLNEDWELLDELTSDIHSYTDTPPAEEEVWYIVIVDVEATCTPTAREIRATGELYSQFMSNIVGRGSDTNIGDIFNNHQNDIQIYPNPTQGQITVQGQDIVRVEISAVNGQKIKEIQSTANYFNIDIKNEAKGLYFVKVTTKQGVVLQKIILE